MNLSELKKMMMMNMNKRLGICHPYLRMKEKIHKGWLFVSTPDAMMKKDRNLDGAHWADLIKFAVMCELGMTSHPYHRIAELITKSCFKPKIIDKANPKEKLGKDLPNNKD